jgi:hypothetical protein
MTLSAAFTFSGEATPLAKKSAAASASISATVDDLSGVDLVVWSVIGTEGIDTVPGDYTLVTSGPKGSTVTFTVGTEGTGGILQCKVTGGVTGDTKRAKFFVPTAEGREILCFGEWLEGGVTGYVPQLNEAIRSVGGGGGSGDITAVTTSAPLAGGATSGAVALSITAATTGAAGSMSAADKTKLDAATDAATASTLALRDASGRLKVADGAAAGDAVNKGQLDAVANGLDWKASVRAATTANITLSGAQTIDGVSVIAGDRVLVKDQSTGSQNGIYVAAAGAWSRSTDADANAEVTAGLSVFVTEGTANGDAAFVLTTNDAIVVGTTALAFSRVGPTTAAAIIEAIDGQDLTPNSVDVGAGSIAAASAFLTSIETTEILDQATGLRISPFIRTGTIDYSGTTQPWSAIGDSFTIATSTVQTYAIDIHIEKPTSVGDVTNPFPQSERATRYLVVTCNASNVVDCFIYGSGAAGQNVEDTGASWDTFYANDVRPINVAANTWQLEWRKGWAGTAGEGTGLIFCQLRLLSSQVRGGDTSPSLFGAEAAASAPSSADVLAALAAAASTVAVNGQTVSDCAGVTRADDITIEATGTTKKVTVKATGTVAVRATGDAADTCAFDVVSSECRITSARAIRNVAGGIYVTDCVGTSYVCVGGAVKAQFDGTTSLVTNTNVTLTASNSVSSTATGINSHTGDETRSVATSATEGNKFWSAARRGGFAHTGDGLPRVLVVFPAKVTPGSGAATPVGALTVPASSAGDFDGQLTIRNGSTNVETYDVRFAWNADGTTVTSRDLTVVQFGTTQGTIGTVVGDVTKGDAGLVITISVANASGFVCALQGVARINV